MISKILNTFGTRALSAAINLLIAVVLSQYLGPAGKGIQSLILTTITFILVFANLVGGATLVYLVPRHDASRLVVPSYAWTFITSFAAGILLWFFPVIDRAFIIHTCALSVLNSLTSIHTSVLIGKERIKPANLTGLIQPVLLILALAVCFLVLKRATVDSYIQSLYISFAGSFLASLYWCRKFCRPFSLHTLKEYLVISKEMVHFGVLNQVAHVTQMLSFRLSYYILNHFHGEAAVGVYSNGISLAESIWLIAKSISLVQYARISNLEDREQAARLTVSLIKISVALSLVILLPMVLLPAGIYVYLFGPGFEDTRVVIWSLGLGVLLYNYSILIGHYFSGTGRYYINAITSSAGLVASVCLYYWIIPHYGCIGAGIATTLSYAITSGIFIYWFSREYHSWHRLLIPRKEDFQSVVNVIRNKKES